MTKRSGIRRTIVFDESTDNELNQYVDGNEFRNRSHAVQHILKLWLKWRRERSAQGEQTQIFDIRPPKKAKPLK